jgi:hypothetical protein
VTESKAVDPAVDPEQAADDADDLRRGANTKLSAADLEEAYRFGEIAGTLVIAGVRPAVAWDAANAWLEENQHGLPEWVTPAAIEPRAPKRASTVPPPAIEPPRRRVRETLPCPSAPMPRLAIPPPPIVHRDLKPSNIMETTSHMPSNDRLASTRKTDTNPTTMAIGPAPVEANGDPMIEAMLAKRSEILSAASARIAKIDAFLVEYQAVGS